MHYRLDQPVDLGDALRRALDMCAAPGAPHLTVEPPTLHDLPLVLGDEHAISTDLADRVCRARWESGAPMLRITAALVSTTAGVRLELAAGSWRQDVTFALAGAAFPGPR